MADEVVAPVTPAPVAPAFDPALVQQAVKASMGEFVKEAQARQAEAKAAEDAEAASRARPAGFEEMFKPHLDPISQVAKAAEHRAIMATDAVEFYTNPKFAEAATYREKVESLVQEQAKKGNIVSRKDAWAYLRGGELYDTIQAKTDETRAAKIKLAQEAEVAGPGVTAPKFAKPITELTTDELGAALKDVRF